MLIIIVQIREMYSDVRILFPRDTDTDKDIIHLVGRKEDVTEVKKQLEAMITELVGSFIFTISLHAYLCDEFVWWRIR